MSTPGANTPGRDTPGLRTPAFDHPGARTPGDGEPSSPDADGVAVDSTGTTTLGSVDGDRDTTVEVVVNATATDFNFQAYVGGESLFDSAQSPSGTAAESFTPSGDANAVTGAGSKDVVFEVTSASASGGANADVDVNVVSEDQV